LPVCVAPASAATRVNCCFDWRDDAGENECTCVSGPMRIGYDTCDAAARAKGGMVVRLCSKYKSPMAGMP
jgi:hypothetical protein